MQADLVTVFRRSSNLDLNEQDRAVWLIESARLKGWLTSSEHEDLDASVVRMMRSLVGQLLIQHKRFDLSFFRRYHASRVVENDINTLCDIFDNLVLELPKHTMLFCVIDSISFYEDHFRRDDTVLAISRLYNVTTLQHNAILKLLVTTPGRSIYVKDYLPKNKILLVPEEADGRRQGFSALSWNRNAGRQVEGLGKELTIRTEIPDDSDEETPTKSRPQKKRSNGEA